LLILCALLLIRQGMVDSRAEAWVTLGDWMKSRYHLRNFLVTIACLVFYIFASEPLGFLLCGTVILAAMFWALAVRRVLILPLAVLITLVIHTVFYKGLRVPLPWGVLQALQW
jgi:putative tricarboxylic transport membrane protein